MTRSNNRDLDRAIRAYMAEHGVKYNVARRALEAAQSSPGTDAPAAFVPDPEVRRCGIVLAPHPEETLQQWIDRCAARLQVSGGSNA